MTSNGAAGGALLPGDLASDITKAIASGDLGALRVAGDVGTNVVGLLDDACINFEGENITPLMYGVFERQVGVVEALISMGVEIDETDDHEETALFWAVRHQTPTEIISLLLAAGANPQERNGDDETPLLALVIAEYAGWHDAVDEAIRERVPLLLRAGADVNAADDANTSALHIACRKGLLGTARLLLERGAAKDRVTQGGLTPADCLRIAVRDEEQLDEERVADLFARLESSD